MYFMTALTFCSTSISAQAKTAEDRAKLLHQAVVTDDSEFVKSFVEENYSKRLLEKYDTERHTSMLNQVHREFKDSKIVSIKKDEGDKLVMIIERNSDGHKVTFELYYDPNDDNKLDGIGIEAGDL